jgi:hypothetical protein
MPWMVSGAALTTVERPPMSPCGTETRCSAGCGKAAKAPGTAEGVNNALGRQQRDPYRNRGHGNSGGRSATPSSKAVERQTEIASNGRSQQARVGRKAGQRTTSPTDGRPA